MPSTPATYSRNFPTRSGRDDHCWLDQDIAFLAPYERQLNAVVQQAANATGVHFIDLNAPNASYSFLGHDVCQLPVVGSASWFNSLMNTSPFQYSFHPNGAGQQDTELSLVANSAGPALSAATPATPTPLSSSQLADLASLPADGPKLSIDQAALGSSGSMQTLSGSGFAPGSSVQVSALSPGDMGTVTADSSGMVRANIGSILGLAGAPLAFVLRGTTVGGDSRIVFAPTARGLDVLQGLG